MRKATTLVLAMAMSFVVVLPASALSSSRGQMHDYETGKRVPGYSEVVRYDSFVSASVRLKKLDPGDAYTVWAVVFNNPDRCSDGVCGEDDVFLAPGVPDVGGPADPSVMWSGIGGVADDKGRLARGTEILVDSAPGQVLFGDGLTTVDAEIHFVIQDHGEASDDAATLLAQTTTFLGGCDTDPATPDCVDVQFSIHK